MMLSILILGKLLDAVSHWVLIAKQMICGMDEWTVKLAENWANHQYHRTSQRQNLKRNNRATLTSDFIWLNSTLLHTASKSANPQVLSSRHYTENITFCYHSHWQNMSDSSNVWTDITEGYVLAFSLVLDCANIPWELGRKT